MSDMKRINAREFQKRFGKVAASLKPGQEIEITMRGKPIGRFTKSRPRKSDWPDFSSILLRAGCSKEVGDQILKEFNDSLS